MCKINPIAISVRLFLTIISTVAGMLQASPTSLQNVAEIPDWWTNVTCQYSETTPDAVKWEYIFKKEAEIRDVVGKGNSAIQMRRELIKYATLFQLSSNTPPKEVDELGPEIASLYSGLGDYRRTEKLFSCYRFEGREEPFCLQQLALTYERLGDTQKAIEVYKSIGQKFKNDRFSVMYSKIAETGVNCLSGTGKSVPLIKPQWWSQYQMSPIWWANTEAKLPPISCFDDGVAYIATTVAKEHDEKKMVKSWSELSRFAPRTYHETMVAIMGIASAYSRDEDHHRAIIYAWAIPEKYSGDVDGSCSALKLISSEYEKLGETNHAEEITVALEEFRKSTKKQ